MEFGKLNREQQTVFTLLKEIRDICRKNDIVYFLSPKLALYGTVQGCVPDSPGGEIIIKDSDMERFRKATEQEIRKDRALESLENNPNFPGLFLRYEDKNTVCFRMNDGYYRYPGIGINIYPIRQRADSRTENIMLRCLESGWQQLCNVRREYDWKAKLCRVPVTIMAATGRKRTGKWIFHKYCNARRTEEVQECLLRIGTKTVRYPSELFFQIRRINLKGEEFNVPEDTDTYLSLWYGSNYEQKVQDKFDKSMTILVSTRISCEEFREKFGTLDSFLKERKKQYKRNQRGKKNREYLDRCWTYVKMKGQGRNLSQKYLDRKEYILNLYHNEDFIRLEEEMQEYGNMMKRYLKYKEVYIPDPKLFEIYLKLPSVSENNGLLKKIKKAMK
ncbi:MAG: hypothetical protein SO401_03680 [Blautia sp.]|nr:hypothetical protein [Blautia sp.]